VVARAAAYKPVNRGGPQYISRLLKSNRSSKLAHPQSNFLHDECNNVLALRVQTCTLTSVAREKKPQADVDGRRARAERTREAIVSALLGLLAEGDLKPSADRVAERAGVSRRVIFQHFSDLEELLTHASMRWFEHVQTILPTAPAGGSFEVRARTFVAAVGHFYDHVSHVRRAALLAAHESKVVAARMDMALQLHREMTKAAFADELANAPELVRERLVCGLAAATSFATWDELRRRQGLSTDEAIQVVVRFIEGLVLSGDFK
jgi:TetR/AcrR family transcriptional regulator, regulator of autoinduction and epiphytic fitness